MPVFGRGDLIIGYVAGDVVTRHDVLHSANIPIDVIPVVLTAVVHPSVIRFIEFSLVVWRKAALVGLIRCILLVRTVVAALLRVSAAGDLLVGNVGGDVITRHDVLHFADVSIDVIPVVLAAVVHIFVIGFIEFALVVRGKPDVLAKGGQCQSGDQRHQLQYTCHGKTSE